MPKGFLPNPDAALLAWSVNFSRLISADPAAYGISPARAAAYAVLNDAYATALAANDPAVRSRVSVANKNAARELLKKEARALARVVYGAAWVTGAQRIALGLNVRRAYTRAAPPATPPAISVLAVTGWTVHAKVYDPASDRRKPPGVIGAILFTYVGETPPRDIKQWRYHSQTGQSRVDVTFPTNVPPGTKVWLSAVWFNNRKQMGPACAPVPLTLTGGGTVSA